MAQRTRNPRGERPRGSDTAPRPRRRAAVTPPQQTAMGTFPVVGIGASAGGLEAFRKLLTALPIDTGIAFVLIPHLDPSHPSMMADLLSGSTAMPVVEAGDARLAGSRRVSDRRHSKRQFE